jgi:midasin
LKGIKSAYNTVLKKFGDEKSTENSTPSETSTESPTNKSLNPKLREEWKKLFFAANKFELQHDQVKNNFAFSFIEGALIKALRNGYWVLLDELNLASSETLESLSSLLDGGSITLNERGDTEPVTRHPNFRVFGCMNPPTDVGKKELPPGLRNRFSEFYVDELILAEDLRAIVTAYLADFGNPGTIIVNAVVEFYMEAKKLALSAALADPLGHRPHYSLRTLCRALDYARIVAPMGYGFARSVFEGISMSFLTQLNAASAVIVQKLIATHILKG